MANLRHDSLDKMSAVGLWIRYFYVRLNLVANNTVGDVKFSEDKRNNRHTHYTGSRKTEGRDVSENIYKKEHLEDNIP